MVTDLSGGELRARLVQRGVPLSQVERMMEDRDDPDALREILALLD